MNARWMVLLTMGSAMAAGGCQEGNARTQYQSRLIPADPPSVSAALEQLMSREFRVVERSDRGQRLQGAPVEYSAASGGRVNDLAGVPSRLRRSGEARLVGRGGQTYVQIRVDVEREDAGRGVVFAPAEWRTTDSPAHFTAVERDAATTDQQNAVWTKFRRDRTMERALLDELSAMFATPPESQPAGR